MNMRLHTVLFHDETLTEREHGTKEFRFLIRINFVLWRLFLRGIDDRGQVANYVETEQILQLDQIDCSYIQVYYNKVLFINILDDI